MYSAAANRRLAAEIDDTHEKVTDVDSRILAPATIRGEIRKLRAEKKQFHKREDQLLEEQLKMDVSTTASQPATFSAPDSHLAKELEAAWNIPYKDVSSNTSRLHEHLEKCYKKWKRMVEGFYSPYFAVFQSSGHGKSRLIQELCTSHEIPHLFICFRPSTSAGFPLRTRRIADFLTTSPSQQKCDALLQAVLGVFCQATEQESDSATAFEMWENYKNKNVGSLEDEIYKRAIGLVERTSTASICKLTPSPFLFVFDEASELLKATESDESGQFCFHMLRSSLRYYNSGVFAIFTDTLSTITLAPTLKKDPSSRGSLSQKLFAPFHLVVNIDTFNPPRDLDAAGIQQELTPSHLVTKGRILWASIVLGMKRAERHRESANYNTTDEQLLAQTSPDDWLSVIELAAAKLVGRQFGSEWSVDDLSRVACLSVLSARAQLSIAPISDSSSVSVGSHLATCVSISHNQDAVFSMYPSEPAVAAGAFHVVWGDAKRRKKKAMEKYAKLLSHLETSLVRGIVDGGQCGELVARLLLNIAWDLSVRSVEQFYSMISLESFLQNLIGVDRLEEAKKILADETILTAQLCFTHFVPISYVPDQQDLVKLMSRGAAAICQRDQVGVDLIIPLLLEEDMISVFLVSVKNHPSPFDSSWPSSAGSGISLQTVCPELSNVSSYFTLFMQLGARESMIFAGQHKKHSALAVFGLNTFCPSIGKRGVEHLVYQRLRAILNASQGMEGISFDEASTKVIPNLVPLHWETGAGPRAVADTESSTSTTPPPNDEPPFTPQTFCLVDVLSRTRWTLNADTNIMTDEVVALFQQQGLAATILRKSGDENQMKRVLRPVVLRKCICTFGEERNQVVFVTINADDIRLVCTYPVRIEEHGVGLLQYQPNDASEELPDFVQNYLSQKHRSKVNRDQKTEDNRYVDDEDTQDLVRSGKRRKVHVDETNTEEANTEEFGSETEKQKMKKKQKKRKKKKKKKKEKEEDSEQKYEAIETNIDEANTEEFGSETEKQERNKQKKKKRKKKEKKESKHEATETNTEEANTEEFVLETQKRKKKKREKE